MGLQIGVIVDSFRLPLREGIRKAKEIGAEGIQLYAVSGDMDPDNLSRTARADLLHTIRSMDLTVSALCGDLGGHGFRNADEHAWKMEKSKKIMDLAVDLETSVVTTHVGVIPEDENDPSYRNIREACEELAAYGDRVGATFAIETGPETAVRLRSFLDGLANRGVRVNLDPANFVMVTGDDPIQATRTLGDYIVHTHAKDGVMLQQTDPARIYDFFAEGGIGDLRLEEYFLETPLGEGRVDIAAWIRVLRDSGYQGFLTIEREVGENPERDVAQAVRFLREKLK